MSDATVHERNTIYVPATSDAIRQAAPLLRAGGLVAFPTETVYGLGANALDANAVASIFAAKGRPSHNPLIVHISGQEMLNRVVASWPPLAERLANTFWPGPLTLVLPKNPGVPDIVTGGGLTVAVRWPAHPVAAELIQQAGVPVAAPSANRSSELSPTRAEHVRQSLTGRIDMILDGGPTTAGIESTVLDLSQSPPVFLRPGPITLTDIERICGEVRLRGDAPSPGALPSPGLLDRHYAPRTPMELVDSAEAVRIRLREIHARGQHAVALTLGNIGIGDVMPTDPIAYAACLYATLHLLDDAKYDRLLVQMPPEAPEWYAVRDRLRRAATP